MTSRPGSDTAPAVFLVAGLALVAAVAWVPTALGVWHDDGVYLMLGRSLARGEGLRYLGVSGAPPAPKFPPLFPVVLAGVWKVAPEFPGNSPLFQVLNLGILVGAGALFHTYLRRVLELPGPVALAATGLAWLSPGLWSLAVIPLSEPLFLLCLILCLWAATRLETAEGAGLAELGLFLGTFALVFHARTVGLAAAVGVVAALLWLRHWTRALGVGLGAGLVALPWILWSARAGEAVPEGLRGVLGSYGGWFFEQALQDPGAQALALVERMGLLGSQLVHYLVPGGPEWLRWSAGALVLPLLVVGLVRMGSRSRSTVWVILAYLAVIWVWPYNDSRFLVPLLPWAVAGVMAGGWTVLEAPRTPRGRGFRRGAGLAVGLWAVLFAGFAAWALVGGRHGRDYQLRTRSLEQAAGAVARLTPPDAVVGAPELWAALHLYTGRTVAPSARFSADAGRGPVWGSPEEQYRLWLEAGVDHLLAEHGGQVHGQALDRLDQVCPEGAVGVLEIMEGQILVRLGWDETCRRRLGLEQGNGAG